MPVVLPDPEEVETVLDGIPAAFERAQAGARQAAAGDVIELDELACTTEASDQAAERR